MKSHMGERKTHEAPGRRVDEMPEANSQADGYAIGDWWP